MALEQGMRGGAWRALACALLLSVSACKPETDGSSANAPASSAPASRAELREPALWQRLEGIERLGRAHPESYTTELREILVHTAPGSPERAETLGLIGHLIGVTRSRDGVDLLEKELVAWPKNADGRASQADVEIALANAKGVYFRAQGDMREAGKALGELDQHAQDTASPRQLMRARSTQAVVLSEAGEVKDGLRAAQLELDLANGYGKAWRRAIALNDVSICYFRGDQLTIARKTSDQALELGRSDPDPVLMNSLLTLRGIVYEDVGNDQITQQAMVDALAYTEKSGDEAQRALGLSNLADLQLRHGQYAQALASAEQAIPLARKTRRLVAEIGARSNAGLARIALGHVTEGRDEARIAITMDEQNGSTSYVATDWQELGEYLERAGDYAGAVDAFHEYRRVVDQVLRNDTRKAVIDSQERFEAERRAKEIELLNRDNKLKSEQIRARDLSLALWAVLGACAVLVAVLLGLMYQRIRRSNSQLLVSNEKLKVQSECDPLTGLANRRHFQSAIRRMADEGRGGVLSGTMFLIDIDHFKRINDVHGHAAGDTVLVEVARRLRSAVREDDLVVRWGGEEFLIVVGEDPPSAHAQEPSTDRSIARAFSDSRALEAGSANGLAQRLLDLIGGAPVVHGEKPINVSASIGFASFPVAPHGLALRWERAIDLVDTVMYIAKSHGRNKAYGISHIDAADEAAVARLAPRMEAAWHEGRVRLVALQGPRNPAERNA